VHHHPDVALIDHRAMDALLRCNQRLVSSGTEKSMVLQQALVRIVSK